MRIVDLWKLQKREEKEGEETVFAYLHSKIMGTI